MSRLLPILMCVVACSPPALRGLGESCEVDAECVASLSCLDLSCRSPVVCSCPPGLRQCVGDFVGTCNDECSDFVLGDAPCERGCFNGACRAPMCEPGVERKCIEGDVWLCDSIGRQFELEHECANGCSTTGSGVTCDEVPDAGSP